GSLSCSTCFIVVVLSVIPFGIEGPAAGWGSSAAGPVWGRGGSERRGDSVVLVFQVQARACRGRRGRGLLLLGLGEVTEAFRGGLGVGGELLQRVALVRRGLLRELDGEDVAGDGEVALAARSLGDGVRDGADHPALDIDGASSGVLRGRLRHAVLVGRGLLQTFPVAEVRVEDDLQLLLVSALAVGDLVAGAEVGLVHHLAGHDAALDGVADLLEGEAGGAAASTGELGAEGRSVGVCIHGHVDLSFDNYCVTVVSSDATASGGRGAVLRSTGPPLGSTPCSRSPGRGCRPCLARR